MLTSAGVMPKLVSLGRVGFRPTPFDWVPLAVIILLIVIFVLEGVGAIFVALEYRSHLPQWGWTLFSGVIDLLLAFLIWQGWPSSAVWAIGLLVGVNFFFFGLSLTMTALAARSLAPH